MAPMDGLALLRAVREDPATVALAFVFVSARPADAVAAACDGLHVDAVLSKGAAEQELPAAVHAALAGGHGQPAARVLVADDSGLVRSMMRDHLIAAGYEVLEAQDGEEALARIRDNVPDVVLLDRDMPRLDGFSVLDAMQADEATAGIPVVFVTGRATASELADGLGRGAHDYVRSPSRRPSSSPVSARRCAPAGCATSCTSATCSSSAWPAPTCSRAWSAVVTGPPCWPTHVPPRPPWSRSRS